MSEKLIKYYRKKRGMTQKELALALNCAQSTVAKMEMSGIVPHQFRAKLASLFGFDDEDLGEALYFGGKAGVKMWRDFVECTKYFGDAHGRTVRDCLEVDGLLGLFEYFVDLGVQFEMPLIQKDIHVLAEFYNDSEDESPLEAPSFLNSSWEGFWLLFREFDLRLENFLTALDAIYQLNQLDDSHYLELRQGGIGYVWNEVLSCPDEWEPKLLEVLKSTSAQRETYRSRFGQKVAEAWLFAWRSASRSGKEIEIPTWNVRDLLQSADNDWSGRFVVDIKRQLLLGISPDPFIRDLQDRLSRLEDSLAILHKKVDALPKSLKQNKQPLRNRYRRRI